jgi:hypothetical protein
MTAFLKSLATSVTVLFGISVWIILPVRADYAWADGYIPLLEQRGYQMVMLEHSGVLDIARPWTLFKSPPSAVYFIQPASLSYTAEGNRNVQGLVIRRFDGRIEEVEDTIVYDCAGQRIQTVSANSGGTTSSDDTNWRDLPETGPSTTALFNAACAL